MASEAQITHAELRVPPPNEAEAAAFAKYHGVTHSFFGMVFGGAAGLIGAEKLIKRKSFLSIPSRHKAACYGVGFLGAFAGKELGKIYGTQQNIARAVHNGQFQRSFPDGIWKDLTITFVTGQPFDSNKHQKGVEIVGQLHPDQVFFTSEEKAAEYRDYVEKNGFPSASAMAAGAQTQDVSQSVQTNQPIKAPAQEYQSYNNLRYPQTEHKKTNQQPNINTNQWGDEIQ